MKSEGTLDWTPPKGLRRIIRIGYSLTEKTNHPVIDEATGLEVDKFDGRAVRDYMEAYIGKYKSAAGSDFYGEESPLTGQAVDRYFEDQPVQYAFVNWRRGKRVRIGKRNVPRGRQGQSLRMACWRFSGILRRRWEVIIVPTALDKLGHARIVEDVVSGGSSAQRFDLRIRESWRRCLSSAMLNPSRLRRPLIVASSELRERRKQADPVYSIAQVEMSGLSRLLNAPVGVMLTDHEGVILSYVGDSRFAEVARSSGLREGAVWSEAEQGTNGMGTCLVMRQPVLIQEEEHFLMQNAALTCCAAPILDGCGRLVGALNISGRLQLSAAPTLALVKLAVQNIENRALLEEYRQYRLLRFHPHREFIATAGEGILALDDQGRAIAANRGALDWLNAKCHADLYGKPIETLIGLDMNQVERLACRPERAHPLPRRDFGLLCYGVLQMPLADSQRMPAVAKPLIMDKPLERAEYDTLREVLQSCDWNVSFAATQLKVSRRTLHRKLRAHGLRRYSAC